MRVLILCICLYIYVCLMYLSYLSVYVFIFLICLYLCVQTLEHIKDYPVEGCELFLTVSLSYYSIQYYVILHRLYYRSLYEPCTNMYYVYVLCVCLHYYVQLLHDRLYK